MLFQVCELNQVSIMTIVKQNDFSAFSGGKKQHNYFFTVIYLAVPNNLQ